MIRSLFIVVAALLFQAPVFASDIPPGEIAACEGALSKLASRSSAAECFCKATTNPFADGSKWICSASANRSESNTHVALKLLPCEDLAKKFVESQNDLARYYSSQWRIVYSQVEYQNQIQLFMDNKLDVRYIEFGGQKGENLDDSHYGENVQAFPYRWNAAAALRKCLLDFKRDYRPAQECKNIGKYGCVSIVEDESAALCDSPPHFTINWYTTNDGNGMQSCMASIANHSPYPIVCSGNVSPRSIAPNDSRDLPSGTAGSANGCGQGTVVCSKDTLTMRMAAHNGQAQACEH